MGGFGSSSRIDKVDGVVSSQLPRFPIKSVPSNFKSYESSSILIEPLSFIQSKNLSVNNSTLSITDDDINIKTASEKELIIDTILKGVIVDYDKEDLFFCDLIYLAMMRKVLTFGDSPLNYDWTCPHCGENNKSEFFLTECSFNDLEKTDLPIKVSHLELEPPRISRIREFLKLKVDNKDINTDIALSALCVKAPSITDAIELLGSIYKQDDIDLINDSVSDLLALGNFNVIVKCDKKECLRDSYISGVNIFNTLLFNK